MRTLGIVCGLFLASGLQGAWFSAHNDSFIVYSEQGAKEARAQLAELEQFRFSLGELLGRRDLALHPALEIFSFSKEQAAPETITRRGATAIRSGPTITPQVKRSVARLLLQNNIGQLPPRLERGLETFLSTTQVSGAKVIWGTPPPASERDVDWALIEYLVTSPETYSNFRVLLFNLQKGVDEGVAYRNSVGRSPQDVKRAVDAFLGAGNFRTIDGPSRPLNPQRDLLAGSVPPEDMELLLADLLDQQSGARYRAMLNAGQHSLEAQEGLALLALRGGDPSARELLAKAIAGGSKNAYAMVAYAGVEPDSAKAQAALEKALALDPKSGAAHFLLGQRLTDESKKIQEFQLATKLSPRQKDYWVALARALEERRQWPAAVLAWRGAELAAESPEERQKMLEARLAIDGKRLDFEDAERRRIEKEKQDEINRLKAQALAEVRAAEAQANKESSEDLKARAVDWSELDDSGQSKVKGTLVRVDCQGKQRRMVIQTAEGKLVRVDAVKFPEKLTCGPQKPRTVEVAK
jgi:tetratricopeptide (TPR) repeat protein